MLRRPEEINLWLEHVIMSRNEEFSRKGNSEREAVDLQLNLVKTIKYYKMIM